MTTVPPITISRKNINKVKSGENITIRGKFKTANLFNETIHIILYPDDGLGAAVKLQEMDEWTDVILDIKKPIKD